MARRFDRRSGCAAYEPKKKTPIAQSEQLPAVTGTVTMGGKPLDRGTIEFRGGPEAKNKISVGVRDGRFSIPEGELSPGRYRIEIRSEPDPESIDPVQGVP